MTATQCPQCALRFASRNEMSWHLRHDHRSVRPAVPLLPDATVALDGGGQPDTPPVVARPDIGA